MKIRIPLNWNIIQADRESIILKNDNFPGWVLMWEYSKDGYNWHTEKLSESGKFKSGIYNSYKNFSHAIKEIYFNS